ncbi:hypothetical protein DSO57_1017029 [Entomophthora muscae]|uniref:Uncharacterized protein n=1 Tax=Entomophthora muscae TaxID=34485 RepID=A0ACC2TS24_9FUNG|nr:hypothetical protein DSO57_1017029 [Entomophthora muscae]
MTPPLTPIPGHPLEPTAAAKTTSTQLLGLAPILWWALPAGLAAPHPKPLNASTYDWLPDNDILFTIGLNKQKKIAAVPPYWGNCRKRFRQVLYPARGPHARPSGASLPAPAHPLLPASPLASPPNGEIAKWGNPKRKFPQTQMEGELLLKFGIYQIWEGLTSFSTHPFLH